MITKNITQVLNTIEDELEFLRPVTNKKKLERVFVLREQVGIIRRLLFGTLELNDFDERLHELESKTDELIDEYYARRFKLK